MSKEWGNAYWDLFHTLSFKLKTNEKITELYNQFYILCTLLPCPICREHAINYLSKINKNNINTREKLIDLFFNFHNNVNINLKKIQFTKEKYYNLYNSKKIVNVLNHFCNIYLKNSKITKLDINLLVRQKFLPNFIVFMKSNRHIFKLD